jgi:hypothetical protein
MTDLRAVAFYLARTGQAPRALRRKWQQGENND